jgi:general nucleoside transport system permease protein
MSEYMQDLFSSSALQNIDFGLLAVAIFGGAIRVGTPYLFVSLGECITERAGRVNLGLEGTLVLGAMTAYTVSYKSGSFWLASLGSTLGMDETMLVVLAPWLGVLAAGIVGALLGVMHALICNLPRVNFVAVGIAMMVFGSALADYLGKPMIQPVAPKLPAVDFGWWAESEQVRFALRINALFLVGLVLTPVLAWMLVGTRWGMILRLAGESEEAAAAMGYSVNLIRTIATAMGGFLAGIGGSFLSLYFPGSWTESISSGQGLMAVALVIFARWSPVRCLWASLLFGGVGSLGPALQGQNLSSGAVAYLWNSAPYVLTLVIMMITSSRDRAMAGAPGVLTQTR